MCPLPEAGFGHVCFRHKAAEIFLDPKVDPEEVGSPPPGWVGIPPAFFLKKPPRPRRRPEVAGVRPGKVHLEWGGGGIPGIGVGVETYFICFRSADLSMFTTSNYFLGWGMGQGLQRGSKIVSTLHFWFRINFSFEQNAQWVVLLHLETLCVAVFFSCSGSFPGEGDPERLGVLWSEASIQW